MVTNFISPQELGNPKRQPEFYEAAGNRFAILLFTDPNINNELISARAVEAFQQNPNSIDTILVLVKLDNQRFKYLVIERDGSWSEMCGNGARAVAKYLYDSGLARPDQLIILVTKSGKEIGVKALEIDGDTWYQVNMGQVSSVEEDQHSFQGLLGEGFNGNSERFNVEQLILTELDKYLTEPKLLQELFPDLMPNGQPNPLSLYSSYFYELLQRVNTEDEFNQFVQALAYRGLYQAGGEPHTLIEITDPEIVTTLGDVKFSVYLKAVSFLLRHIQNEQNSRLYPQSMNFMFYVIQEDPNKTVEQPTVGKQTNNFTVTMYPAERGAHNGINYDQTGACGTGSCCLGNYLLKHDSRFMGLNKITIVNRSGVCLIVALDDQGNTQLIGQAEQTYKHRTNENETQIELPFVAQLFVERFYYYNPGGEARLNQLAEMAKKSQNPILQLFGKIREIFTKGDKVLAITTIDHPNPRGFWDFYTIVGYLISAYISKKLALELVPISLNTTKDDGSDFPAELSFQSLGHISTKFREVLSKVLNQTTIDPNKSPYQLLIDHLEKIVANKLILNFLKLFLNSFTSESETKEDYRSKIAALVYYLIQNKSGETQNKNVVVRECLLLQALLNSMLDFEEILKEMDNTKISEELLKNIFQTMFKGQLIDAVYPWILDPNQTQVLQEALLLDPKVNYSTPRIFTSGITGSKLAIPEKFKQAISLIITTNPDLVVEYINFYLNKNNKGRITLAKVNDKYLIAIKTKDGDTKFYLSQKMNIRPKNLPEEDLIQVEQIKDIFQNQQNQITIYGFLTGIVLAFGQLHHFGSERGIRSSFLKFLLEKFSGTQQSQEDFKLIQQIFNSSQGLICPDYKPENYGEGKLPPYYPIATDGPYSNPFEVLCEFGTEKLKQVFQALVTNPNNYAACQAILNQNSTTNL